MSAKLKVSIGSDIVEDCMRVILHLNDKPLIEGVIKESKRVRFPDFPMDRSFELDEIREVLKEFILKMESTENVDINEL